jgi:L-aminopeptidase/D-esterase-like protein
MSGNSSGDIFIAFSTANPAFRVGPRRQKWCRTNHLAALRRDRACHREAVINALVASDTMTGVNNRRVIGLPHDRLREVLRKYNRLVNPSS